MTERVLKLQKGISTKAGKSRSQLRLMMLRFGKNKLAFTALCLLAAWALLILITPLFMDYSRAIAQSIKERFQSPGGEHLLGTDQYGRDLLARMLYGGRISLFAGMATVAMALVMGITVGGISGYFGGWIDTVLMRICDVFMSVPDLLLAMAIVAVLGRSTFNMLIALSVGLFPKFARLIRSSILTLRSQEFVEAAKCCGTGTFRILMKHILPNGIGPLIVSATVSLGTTILSIASLGFLGIGVAAPTPEWGTILSENKANIRYYPYLGIVPGAVIALSVILLNLVGDGLRDALDPRTKK
jgi:peptide/nickel transport system permease protein